MPAVGSTKVVLSIVSTGCVYLVPLWKDISALLPGTQEQEFESSTAPCLDYACQAVRFSKRRFVCQIRSAHGTILRTMAAPGLQALTITDVPCSPDVCSRIQFVGSDESSGKSRAAGHPTSTCAAPGRRPSPTYASTSTLIHRPPHQSL
ncbi:hypothetical protein C8Q72DRAFT_578373 [Fomitopsis betulina]|nr:hypothetical protein C8Q72DRAFT_578373 [Fomitopsis betulina]